VVAKLNQPYCLYVITSYNLWEPKKGTKNLTNLQNKKGNSHQPEISTSLNFVLYIPLIQKQKQKQKENNNFFCTYFLFKSVRAMVILKATITQKPGLILFLLVLALANIHSSSQDFLGGNPLQIWHVRIFNKLSGGQKLFLHCKSKDNDLGRQEVPVGSEFSWGFRTNYWGTTLFWCNMRTDKGGRHATFNVFWPTNDYSLADKCDSSDCIWTARDDGIYLRNIPQKRDELLHKWESL
jgi:hypothetical protein